MINGMLMTQEKMLIPLTDSLKEIAKTRISNPIVFVLFDKQSFSYVGTGLPGLNQYYTCLAQNPIVGFGCSLP